MPAVCVDDYRKTAHQRLAPKHWDFIDGGSGDELTLRANRRIFDEIQLRPRVLVDVTDCRTNATLLGSDLGVPVLIAPIAYHQLAHPDGEVATARGAAATAAPFVVSIFASRTVEEIAAAASSPLWMQLYWLRDRVALADLVGRAATAGFRGLVLTVDAPEIGRRRRDLRNGFSLGSDIRAVNLDRALTATAHQRRDGGSAIAAHALETFDRSITWTDLAWLRSLTDLPLLLKGVLTAEDAELAVDHGIDGIIVSNHGGRQLDGAVPALVALPEVVAAVGGRCPVMVDGCIRGGRDIFVALALGADAVLVGRPVLWALAAEGEQGVGDLLTLLRDELANVMALAGCRRLSDIGPAALARGQHVEAR